MVNRSVKRWLKKNEKKEKKKGVNVIPENSLCMTEKASKKQFGNGYKALVKQNKACQMLR